MKDAPRISVVTPSLNQVRFLERALQSVIEQGYPNTQYFVIDGGSNDGSVELIKKYARHLAGWVSEKDRGQADAIDKGFHRCTGEIMAYLNSSDEYEPGAFSRIAAAYSRRKAALYYGDVTIIDEESQPLDIESGAHLDLETMIFENIFPFQPGTFWTRTAYEKCGGIDPSFHYYMDLDLFVRLGRVGSIQYMRGPLARLRKHSDAKTAGHSAGWAKERERILKAYTASGSPLLARRVLSLLKRLTRLAVDRRWYEVGKLFRKVRAEWKPKI